MDNKVTIRFWGDFACFTPPALKTERFSYPFPTPSACRGLVSAILWKPEMYYWMDNLVILKAGHRVSAMTNGVQDIPRKPFSISEHRMQRHANVLADVDYLVTVEIHIPGDDRNTTVKFVEMLKRRASKGQQYRKPYFGCREFGAYFELVEEPSRYTTGGNSRIPNYNGLMLYDRYSPFELARNPANAPLNATYFVPQIESGNRVDFHPERIELFSSIQGGHK